MSKEQDRIIGTFPSPEETTVALAALSEVGLKDITLYSPVDPEEASIPIQKVKSSVGRFTLLGAIFGIVLGLIFSIGSAILYPVDTGGMPILSLPAIGIITFDLMLLCAILGTIFGFLYCAIWASRTKQFVPKAVSRDCFGISVYGNQNMLKAATEVLKKTGALKVGKQIATLWLGLAWVFLIPALVLGFPWSQDMVDQLARQSQENLVSTSPSIVPRQGRSFEATTKDESAWLENPAALSEASFKRGKQLYETFCVICHGKEGKGDGIMAERIGEFPDFSEQEFLDQPDGCIYFVITHGANFESEVLGLVVDGMDEHDEGALIFGEAEHSHDSGSDHEDEFGLSEKGHEDEHSHGDENLMVADSGHEHGSEDEHAHEDDGHDHAPSCGKGHEHGAGGGHGHGDEASGDEDEGHGHGGDKKHFMPPHKDAILPIGRWHIVNYIKYELGQ